MTSKEHICISFSTEAGYMNATLSKKLRFSDVVYAIGSTPKAVRLWLQRGLVEIHTPKLIGGGWTEYSFLDIAILALVRSLVNFGVDVPTAGGIANTIMSDHFFPMHKIAELDDGDMPVGSLAMMWGGHRLYLHRDGDQWHMKLVALWESDLDRKKMIAKDFPDRASPGDAEFDPALPSGVATLRREHEPAPVYISIDVASVLRTAFERANESVTYGGEDDAK
ncbi:hypothetical protein QO002_000907 [Pararhizobium capsulatum DSM 1112]|uniref:HTH merR-type domain-containing protein n=1 Tax=Pararhizobium capsulatum DSM 1112 TaxID=1121113 RepID=A0ABU0BKK4_9HYPH|nr:MerR family transcriptional regulator [Pararhizobium capsulatum]MDQ0318769.1 hypothetical protein [Pararhizobium capsulatum DSM 1112]